MSDRTLTRPDQPHAAHDTVSAQDAAALYAENGLDWAVSGDMSLRGYGTIGARRAAQRAGIWRALRVEV